MRRLVIFIFCFFSSFHLFANELSQSFETREYRYSIRYPTDWKVTDKEKGTVVFQYKNGVSVNIQTIYTQKGGGKYISVKSLMDDFYGQVPLHTMNAKFLNRVPFVLVDLNGEQTTLTFRENKITYKQWQIMLTTDDGLLFEAFAYRAPENIFDKYLPVAKQMLQTWNIYK